MQTTLGVDVLGVVQPGAVQAVAATRNGRVGCWPRRRPSRAARTSGRSPTADPFVTVTVGRRARTCVPLIEARLPVRRSRSSTPCAHYCAPLREAEVDTVILGCTHYPLVRPMLQRMLGRGVDDRHLRRRRSRARSSTCSARRGLGNPARRRGRLPLPLHRRRRGVPRARARASCSCRSAEVEPVALGARELVRRRRRERERSGGRAPDELRPITIEPGFVRTATGSALISLRRDARDLHRLGPGVRPALDGGPGPRLGDRRVRDAPRLDRRPQAARRHARAAPDGRTVEIQRLIGRSLRGVVDFEALGERTIYVDCDVLQADGGTRCASITGGYVALALACRRLQSTRASSTRSPLTGSVAAVSCGDRRRRAAARPRLPRGLDRGGRRERRHDRRRRARRGPGDGRAHAALARPPRRAARARAARHRGAARGAGGRRRGRRAVRLLLATRNAHKLREFERLLPGVALDPLPDERRRCRPRTATRTPRTR